jgi:hypothetical protein
VTDINPKISVCHLLTVTAADLSLALGLDGRDRRPSSFCRSGCTLSAKDAVDLVSALELMVRRYRAARASGIERSIVSRLEALFHLLADAIERCVDLSVETCVCSWERRIGNAEALTNFLDEIAHAYWSTGADHEWMYKDLERLACLTTDVVERGGSFSRPADSDQSARARADRLAVRLFDAANDLACNNWAQQDWMSVVPVA